MKMYELIRQHIVSQGIMFKFVADRCSISQKKFYRLMNGKTDMSVDEFERICKDGLSVDPAFFLNKKSQKMRSA